MKWNEVISHPTFHIWFPVLIASVVSILLRWAVTLYIRRFSHSENTIVANAVRKRFSGFIFFFIPSVTLYETFDYSYPDQYSAIKSSMYIFVVFSFTYLIIRCIYVIQDVLYNQFDTDKDDNLRERKARTQIIFIRKIAIVFVSLVAVAIVLLNFESVRNYGTTLLTSAGVAGIIIGFAAQKTLSNLLAGIQIAFTQPVRIHDAVVVENEWGWIEEINLTYVVVKIWDLRRLVLPITYFTDKPFQNWTRTSSQILGSVFLFVDYRMPLEPLRKEFYRILEESKLWDKQSKVLQVVDTTEKTMQLRLLVTARNSPETWDLRCEVREKMIDFLQKNYPEHLPTSRLQLDKE